MCMRGLTHTCYMGNAWDILPVVFLFPPAISIFIKIFPMYLHYQMLLTAFCQEVLSLKVRLSFTSCPTTFQPSLYHRKSSDKFFYNSIVFCNHVSIGYSILIPDDPCTAEQSPIIQFSSLLRILNVVQNFNKYCSQPFNVHACCSFKNPELYLDTLWLHLPICFTLFDSALCSILQPPNNTASFC